MSPARNGSLAIQRFEGSDAIEIRNGITFDFYTGLPHVLIDVFFFGCRDLYPGNILLSDSGNVSQSYRHDTVHDRSYTDCRHALTMISPCCAQDRQS